ncbi:homeotic protein ultrabithorax [Trichonephila clavipes]|nr:homeotic protein ultrabithorax [Trichonephila clavipes]
MGRPVEEGAKREQNRSEVTRARVEERRKGAKSPKTRSRSTKTQDSSYLPQPSSARSNPAHENSTASYAAVDATNNGSSSVASTEAAAASKLHSNSVSEGGSAVFKPECLAKDPNDFNQVVKEMTSWTSSSVIGLRPTGRSGDSMWSFPVTILRPHESRNHGRPAVKTHPLGLKHLPMFSTRRWP